MKCLTTLILPLAILLFSVSCKKDSTKIESGFTCKIDGKRWRTSTSDFKVRENDCRISQKGESIFIKARNSGEDFALLVHTAGKIVTEGRYPLNSNAYLVGVYGNPSYGDFITGNGYEGEIEIIKIDKEQSRISGRFHFIGYNDKVKQSRSITDGTFNILYLTY
ncbi:hypothetical protein EON73_02900 [bacterium]|nr:MAG: hypothetical protein EON73_02900 [bacterium]